MSKRIIGYQQFQLGHKNHEFTVRVDGRNAGDFVMSPLGDMHNKPAHLFWTWLGIVMVFPLPIILWIFKGWIFAAGSFTFGLAVNREALKSAGQFVVQNMLEDETFCSYVLFHKGAIIQDKEGNEITFEAVQKAALLKMAPETNR